MMHPLPRSSGRTAGGTPSPARMASLGKWNWYLPRWLGRLLPHISIEGEEYFAARDQHPAARQIQVASTGPSGPGQ